VEAAGIESDQELAYKPFLRSYHTSTGLDMTGNF